MAQRRHDGLPSSHYAAHNQRLTILSKYHAISKMEVVTGDSTHLDLALPTAETPRAEPTGEDHNYDSASDRE